MDTPTQRLTLAELDASLSAVDLEEARTRAAEARERMQRYPQYRHLMPQFDEAVRLLDGLGGAMTDTV